MSDKQLVYNQNPRKTLMISLVEIGALITNCIYIVFGLFHIWNWIDLKDWIATLLAYFITAGYSQYVFKSCAVAIVRRNLIRNVVGIGYKNKFSTLTVSVSTIGVFLTWCTAVRLFLI